MNKRHIWFNVQLRPFRYDTASGNCSSHPRNMGLPEIWACHSAADTITAFWNMSPCRSISWRNSACFPLLHLKCHRRADVFI